MDETNEGEKILCRYREKVARQRLKDAMDDYMAFLRGEPWNETSWSDEDVENLIEVLA